ncbi:hypothetical protein E3N88_33837 [Mikania micrantha]|uniref:Uncharacterized protein n=1 Tax=Mikania micrantha TaxID=192012 RepID=A0A5N6MD31_9ASTR|nr:hypothetical protein E3N88_33837 [Mikania micrantha]
MCDQSGGEVGHRRHQTTEQSVGDGGSGTTNDWRATIGRRWRIMDEQESARDGRKMIGDDRRPEEPQSHVNGQEWSITVNNGPEWSRKSCISKDVLARLIEYRSHA